MQGNQQPFDRRTLLAFLLMGVVWIGWFALFPQESPEPADSQDEVAASTAPTNQGDLGATPSMERRESTLQRSEAIPDTGSVRVVAQEPGAWRQVADADRGTPIVVRTPLFEAEIDAVGGDVLSWRLRKFDRTDGRPVDLVNDRTLDPGTQAAHALRVILEERALDLRRVQFTPNTREIVLDADSAPADLVLRADREARGGVELVYRFSPDRYGFDVEARIRPMAGESLPVGWEVSWPGGIAASEPDSVTEYREFRAVARIGDEIHKVKYDGLNKGDGSKGRRAFDGSVSWAGVESLYFLSAIMDSDPKRGQVRLDGEASRGVQSFEASLGVIGSSPTLAKYTVYMGPVDYDILSSYNQDPWNVDLTGLVDLGPSIFRWVAELTLGGLRLLYQVVPNWGLTIILFSVMTKLLFWPLTKSSTMSMRRMQEMQPKMKKLQEKYKDDPQRQSKEMMALYKEHGVNPLNMGGCLPLLVQMPVFWALFTILRKSIDLRQAEFAFWIHDLSQPDVLFKLPFSLPVFGDNFSLLPILMSVGMYLQTKFQQTPAAGASDNPMAQQMKMMTTLMPVMMFFFFYNSPSGLVLYWLVNTVLTALQTWRISKTMPPAATPASTS